MARDWGKISNFAASKPRVMKIEYNEDKTVQCWARYVANPEDRVARRAFRRMFNSGLEGPAVKLHDRMLHFGTVGAYNAENRIEAVKGRAGVMKARVTLAVRKFFIAAEVEEFEMTGSIVVISINNHDYKAI